MLNGFFQALQHLLPVLFEFLLGGGVFRELRAAFIGLRQRDLRIAASWRELVRDQMIVFWFVRFAGERAPMGKAEPLLHLYVFDLALVFKLFPLPVTAKIDGAALMPIGLYFGAKEIALNDLRRRERVPNFGRRRSDDRGN